MGPAWWITTLLVALVTAGACSVESQQGGPAHIDDFLLLFAAIPTVLVFLALITRGRLRAALFGPAIALYLIGLSHSIDTRTYPEYPCCQLPLRQFASLGGVAMIALIVLGSTRDALKKPDVLYWLAGSGLLIWILLNAWLSSVISSLPG